MLTLRSNSYEGRCLSLTVEETGLSGTDHILTWTLTSSGGISSRYYVSDTTVTIAGKTVYFYDAPYWTENVDFPFPITAGSVSGTLQVPHSASVEVTLSTRVYVSTTPQTHTGTLLLNHVSADTGAGQAARITAAENGTLGGTVGVRWTPRQASHAFTLSYVLSRTESAVTEKNSLHRPAGTVPYRGIIPLDYQLARTIPAGVSRELEITLTTYSSGAFLESEVLGRDTVTITVTVPQDDFTRPVISAGSCRPAPDLLGGAYIQSRTGAEIASVTAEGKLGAAIVRTYLRCEGENYDGPSQALAQWGQVGGSLYALDSRGFLSEPYPVTLEVLPYLSPKLRPVEGRSRITAQRCTQDGTPDDQGAYLSLWVRRSYSPVMLGGVPRNLCEIAFRHRPSGGQWSGWQQILAPEAASDEVRTGPLLGTLEPGVSYEMELRAMDTLGGESRTLLTLAGSSIYWHRDGRLGSLGFGEQVREEDVFLIGANKTLKLLGALALEGEAAQTLLDLAHPVGSILETVSPESPQDTLGGTWVALSGSEEATRWRRTG